MIRPAVKSQPLCQLYYFEGSPFPLHLQWNFKIESLIIYEYPTRLASPHLCSLQRPVSPPPIIHQQCAKNIALGLATLKTVIPLPTYLLQIPTRRISPSITSSPANFLIFTIFPLLPLLPGLQHASSLGNIASSKVSNYYLLSENTFAHIPRPPTIQPSNHS